MKTVLIVDDTAFIRLNLVKILQKDFKIAGEAENGKKAVEMYKELSPDLVIMDIIMPVMNGIDAIKTINDIDPDSRIIVCSAMGQRKMVKRALAAGARDFIVKPFEEERILEAAKKLA